MVATGSIVAHRSRTYILTYDAVYRKAETLSSGGKPALFKSKDMHQWEYLGPVISGANTMRYPFEEIACPEFFSLGEKSMLLSISHTLGAQYYIGTAVIPGPEHTDREVVAGLKLRASPWRTGDENNSQ